MVDSSAPVILVDSQVICEFLEETVDRMPLISGTAVHRAEIRRLVSLFDNKLYFEVTAPLMNERMLKRLVHRQAPDAAILRGAMKNANSHLDYIDWLLDHRRWLAGPVLSLADFAAAAQISVSDYLGGVDWRGHENSREWYAAMKSRPSFQPILAERMEVILPPDHYDQPDF